jgi:hypothetical protein
MTAAFFTRQLTLHPRGLAFVATLAPAAPALAHAPGQPVGVVHVAGSDKYAWQLVFARRRGPFTLCRATSFPGAATRRPHRRLSLAPKMQ